MKPETKEKLGIIKDSGLNVAKVLADFSWDALKLAGNGIVAGTAYVAPRVRDVTNKVAPYVLPNAAILGAMNAGIEGFDSVLSLPEWSENGAMTLGTLALGYANAQYLGSELQEKISEKWNSFTPNLKFAGLAALTTALTLPAPVRGSIVEVFQRGQDIGSQVFHGNLDDDAVIAKYAKYTPPVEGRNGQEIVDQLEHRHEFGSWRVHGSHRGLDIICDVGDELFPIAGGRITQVRDYAGTGLGNGKTVRYKLADGHEVTYLHLSEFSDVEVGDVVTPKTVVGYCGHTGNASADNVHVHMQIDDNVGRGGNVSDPTPYMLENMDDDFENKVRRRPQIYMPFLRNLAKMDGYDLE